MRHRLLRLLAAAAVGVAVVGLGWVWSARQGAASGGRGWPAGWHDPARALVAQAAQAAAKADWAQAAALAERALQEHPATPAMDRALLVLGDAYAQQNRLVDARQAYRRLLEERPDSPVVGEAQHRLGDLNIRLLCSPVVTAQDAAYEVRPGDSLAQIAQTFHTTVELLEAANRLSGDVIHPRLRLKVPRASFSVVVDKSQNTLTLKNGEEVLKVYHVATGTENSTPIGAFHIVNRIPDPPWYTPQGVIPFGDPRNILGTRWLGFDRPGYGIHGTADPSSIGTQATAGCVRLANHDVEELYMLLPVGTPVTIVD